MTEKPTRAQLEATIAALEKRLADLSSVAQKLGEQRDAKCRELDRAIESEKKTRDQFADLKERLVIAESDNQRMRGYITRVQEDDVVREELIAVGDPAGEQRLVPKRKPENFCAPTPYRMIGGGIECSEARGYSGGTRDRPPPKHWVTY